jgi:hypothetical protein
VLVRADGDGALAIGQQSHAWLAGQLARAWGNERFPAPEPREAIALGAEQHDLGWALFDLSPGLDPGSGLPRSFLQITVEEHLQIWRSAPERLLTQSLHAALVVSLHGRSLSELRAQHAPAQAQALSSHIEAERVRQARLLAALDLSEADARLTRRQMWTWDGISLALCNAWHPFTAKDVPTRDGLVDLDLETHPDGSVELEPWPFSEDRVEVRCEARRLPARYTDEAAMTRTLERADPLTLTFVLEPRRGSSP